jgi:hypothetical protein
MKGAGLPGLRSRQTDMTLAASLRLGGQASRRRRLAWAVAMDTAGQAATTARAGPGGR